MTPAMLASVLRRDECDLAVTSRVQDGKQEQMERITNTVAFISFK